MIFIGLNTDQIISFKCLDDRILEDARLFVERSTPRFKLALHAVGMIPQDHLEHLFKQASHVLLPTTYEGFGLPLTEAVS